MSDFCGTFKDITNKIDYFKKLGINASKNFSFVILCSEFLILVQLMPINQFSGTHSWGYNTRYNLAVRLSIINSLNSE